MAVHTRHFTVDTRASNEMHDVTGEVETAVQQSGIRNGIVTTFVTHTTAAVIIGEYESGLVTDIGPALERFMPPGAGYRHNELNADDNAHSHLVGSIMGPSESVPVVDGRPMLGMWQRIILLELDTHPRTRRLVIQVVGE